MRARMWLLITTHVALVIASVFIMDWVIRDRLSADLWAVSACGDVLCSSRPLDDAHATTTIWQTLLFSSLVLWQGGARALGLAVVRPLSLVGFMIGSVGTMSVALMCVVLSRGDGLTSAPLVLAAAYVTGFLTLHYAVEPEGAQLARTVSGAAWRGHARARRIPPARVVNEGDR